MPCATFSKHLIVLGRSEACFIRYAVYQDGKRECLSQWKFEKMLEMNENEPGHTELVVCILFVLKKDSSLQFRIYYQKFEQCDLMDSMVMPPVNQFFNLLRDKIISFTQYAYNSYWQLKRNDKNNQQSAITSPYNLLWLARRPFWLQKESYDVAMQLWCDIVANETSAMLGIPRLHRHFHVGHPDLYHKRLHCTHCTQGSRWNCIHK